jgi:GNAT superfamily N-acetyltransferase
MGTRLLNGAEAMAAAPRLGVILADAVAHGASVNFMRGYTAEQGAAFYARVAEGVAAGERLLLVAEVAGEMAGTAMIIFAPQPNQPYRADVSKVLVHSAQRRKGIGAQLMHAVEKAALDAGRTLLVLDTERGSAADTLYRGLGWQEVGTIPGMAYTVDGVPADATFFFKQLAPTPVWTVPA